MADQEPKDAKEGPVGAPQPDSKPTLLQASYNQIREFVTKAGRSISSLGFTARVLIILVAAILGAVISLWVIDKVVFYYLARSYVDQVANVFDLNDHLANALVLLTFIGAIFFARYLWSFSSQRRLVGIVGISALLIGHSLVLWYGTRTSYFDRSGTAVKCYVLTRDGKVTFGEHPGIDPATGRQCRSITPEMLERLKAYQTGRRPQQIIASNPTFFDPRTGEPIVWYYRSKENEIQIFDLMGFQPDTGDELTPITADVVSEWKTQYAQRSRRVPNRVDPDTYVFFDPLSGVPHAWYWRGADGSYEFYDSPGYEPQTGEALKVATPDVVDAWKQDHQRHANAPQVIDPSTYPFFDPITGVAQVWYWHGDNGVYEFYNAPGYEPRTGDKLSIVTRDVVEKWRQDSKHSSTGPSGPTGLQMRQQTAVFLDALYRATSSSDNDAMTAANDNYADQVNYFGKPYTHDQIMAELQNFDNRWPMRLYQMEQGSLQIDCNEQSLTCTASGLLDFDCRSLPRNQRSWGVATFSYVLQFESSTMPPKIIQEVGDVKVRNLEPFSYPAPLPPNAPPPNAGVPTNNDAVMRALVGGILNRIGR
jgi:hypothetical protein